MSVALKNTQFWSNEVTFDYFCDFKSKSPDFNKYGKFIIRLFPEQFEELKVDCRFMNGDKWIGLCPPNDKDKTKVKHYNFTEMEFVDENCKDNIYSSFTTIVPIDEKELFIEILKNKFDITVKTNAGNSISITFNTDKFQQTIHKGMKFIDNETITKYPINILSLGRYTDKTGTTHKLLSKMKINHYLWVEPQEFKVYESWYNPTYCVLKNCECDYSTTLKMGSQSVRNHIIEYWENFPSGSPKKIWMLDDNIICYKRMNNGCKTEYEGAGIFTTIEKYTEHLENVKLCSHNLNGDITQTNSRSIISENGKHYSSLLISLGTGLRFEFKYNEDVIFSLRTIMSGFNSLCFSHINFDKKTSGLTVGGNQQIYGNHTDAGYATKFDKTLTYLKTLDIPYKVGKDINDYFVETYKLSIEPEKRKQKIKSKKHHYLKWEVLDIIVPPLEIEKVVPNENPIQPELVNK